MKNNIRQEYLDHYTDHNHIPILPKLKNKNYIGVEVECLVRDINDLEQLIPQYGLEMKVVIGGDSSIDSYKYNNSVDEAVEIRLLTSEKEFQLDLKNLSNCLREVKAEVNPTCGLHVHLDCENIKSNVLINKLKQCKDLIYNLLPEHRQQNEFCEFGDSIHEHHNWINISDEHNTVEVRCHEGTINMKNVERFIKLLLSIKYSKSKKKQIDLSNLKLEKSVKLYFQNRLKKYSSIINKKGDQYYV